MITGEVEAELKGHNNRVTSVAFAQDGSQVVSGSEDKTVQIWNAIRGEVESELEGHRVVSGSDDKTVQIWNATGEVEIELESHRVKSVAFSQDGSLVASGSYSDTVLIWNVMTGEVEAELVGDNHESVVTSVAFSQDGS